MPSEATPKAKRLNKRSFLIAALIIVIAVSLSFAALAGYCWHWLNQPAVATADQMFVVAKGQTLTRVANNLGDRDILKYPLVWRVYARFFKPEPVKAGEFLFSAGSTPVQILSQLQKGEVVQYSVSLIEGKTLHDYLQALHSQPKVKQTLNGLGVKEIAKLLGIEFENPEGWFFPDTYVYTSGDTDQQILTRAYGRMLQQLELAWQNRASGLPYKSSYEALIMASIVEKETGAAFERPMIAGVFVRRLQKKMRLQTDPTVIYGLGLEFDGNLTRKHLKTPTPYNTYTQHGLPPTPIANPGREAIQAALNPADGDTLYFVARGDGTHEFSATLAQHNSAVRKYQMHKRASNYRSSPSPEASATTSEKTDE